MCLLNIHIVIVPLSLLISWRLYNIQYPSTENIQICSLDSCLTNPNPSSEPQIYIFNCAFNISAQRSSTLNILFFKYSESLRLLYLIHHLHLHDNVSFLDDWVPHLGLNLFSFPAFISNFLLSRKSYLKILHKSSWSLLW